MTLLFRPEAVAHASRRLAGDVVLATPTSFRILAGFAVAVVIAALVFVSLATYARKETVVGWLSPDRGMIRLAARQAGVLETVMVREGDWVDAGQPVAELRLSADLEGGDAYAALSRSIDAQSDAARTSADSELQTLTSEDRLLVDRAAALRRELAEANRRADLQRERLALSIADLERAEALAAQGFLPRRQLDGFRTSQLAADQQLSEYSAAVLMLERQIAEAAARLGALPNEIKAAEARALSAHAILDQQRTMAEQQATIMITATVPGRVTALPFQVGQTIAANTAIAVMTPQGSTLEAVLYVPSRSSGFVKQGQEVRLLYQAFPYQKFGAGSGRVRSISRTVLAPSELAIPGLRLEEPVFRVSVDLSSDRISAYGETLPLQPGMLLTADVVIDRRSLIEWLFDPLFAAGRR